MLPLLLIEMTAC